MEFEERKVITCINLQKEEAGRKEVIHTGNAA